LVEEALDMGALRVEGEIRVERIFDTGEWWTSILAPFAQDLEP
jgi:hypothetical protein